MNDELIFTDCIRDKQIKFAKEHGWGLNPLVAGSKEPQSGTHGVLSLSRDYEQLQQIYGPDVNFGIPAKGNDLLILDIDVKHASKGKETISRLMGKLGPLPKTLVVKTPSGGLHVYFNRPKLKEGRKVCRKGWDGIDIQYDDFYTLSAGARITNAEKHPESLGDYVIRNNDPLADLPQAWQDALPAEKEYGEKKTHTGKARICNSDGFKAWEDYNQRGDIEALLQEHGWAYAGSDTAQSYWTRPGKREGISATLREIDGVPVFYIFSTDVEGLEPDKGYSPASLYYHYKANGDPSIGAKELFAAGYGVNEKQFSEGVVRAARNAAKQTVGMTPGGILRLIADYDILNLNTSERDALVSKAYKSIEDKQLGQLIRPGANQKTKDLVAMLFYLESKK